MGGSHYHPSTGPTVLPARSKGSTPFTQQSDPSVNHCRCLLSRDKSREYFGFALSISSATCKHAACLMGIQVTSRSSERAGAVFPPGRGKPRLSKSAAALVRAKRCWISLNFWNREETEQRKITKKTDEEENAEQKKMKGNLFDKYLLDSQKTLRLGSPAEDNFCYKTSWLQWQSKSIKNKPATSNKEVRDADRAPQVRVEKCRKL